MIDFQMDGRQCSFCGTHGEGSVKLASGYGVLICPDCVTTAHQDVAQPSAVRDSSKADPYADLSGDDLLAKLQLIVGTRRQVDEFLQAYVEMLRERRMSWASIGGALGISRQAAWERFTRPRAL